jgi:hypothetical protein
MSGARKAAPPRSSVLLRIAGPAVAVALLATIVVLLVFGDRLVGGGGGDGPEQDAAPGQETVAAPVDAEQRDEVVEAASALLNRWSQPDLDYDAWWKGLRPLLTPGGREAYAFTDPRKVPELADLSADHVVLNPSGATATVWFETSDGVFGVDLSRKDATGAWLANRVVFPGQESMFA